MPETVTGVGAVAMPDGRVLICGGVVVEVKKGGVVSITIWFNYSWSPYIKGFYLLRQDTFQLAARNNTMCYYWVAKSREIKRLEYFSKLPFNVSAQIE